MTGPDDWTSDFERAVVEHDAALAARGLDVWIGNEPTFTDRTSNAPEWNTGALGDDKRVRAERLLAHVAVAHRGAVVLRTIGRQYPGEAGPRWCFGIYARRDGASLWSGPPDPLLGGAIAPSDADVLHRHLESSLVRHGFRCRGVAADDRRVVLTTDPERVLPDAAADPRLLRASIHAGAIPEAGLADDLAREGLLLLLVSEVEASGGLAACVDLPAFDDVECFARVLAALAEAANAGGVGALVLRGHAPPVDATVCWATVTPDPAVVEVNMAPHGSVRDFLRDNRRCYAAAEAVGLRSVRLHYNGAVADSGGGGQITFGGRSPAQSPFFEHPRLLPRLVRYAIRHPALSYLFAHDSIGGSGQSVRADENGRDAFHELNLALTLLERQPAPTPVALWQSLAPSLTDSLGNSHRADINVEKLWNPYQPGRGQLGLAEFRAFRMQHTPERAASLAVLVRSILAMLVARDVTPELADWGAALHDRFALPFYLEADLREIARDLEAAGLPLAPAIRAELEVDRCRPWATVAFGRYTLSIRRALEFWPLIGDATSQQGTSRFIDASTSRVEIVLRAASPREGEDGLDAVIVRAQGVALPMRAEADERGPVRVFGVRYRSFAPFRGLHPALGAQDPLRLVVVDPGDGRGDAAANLRAIEVSLHGWRPDGLAYDTLPDDFDDAAARRAARCVVRSIDARDLRPGVVPPPAATSPWSLDVRYLPT